MVQRVRLGSWHHHYVLESVASVETEDVPSFTSVVTSFVQLGFFSGFNLGQAATTSFVCWVIIYDKGGKLLRIMNDVAGTKAGSIQTRRVHATRASFARLRRYVLPSSVPSIIMFLIASFVSFLRNRFAYWLAAMFIPSVLFTGWGMMMLRQGRMSIFERR